MTLERAANAGFWAGVDLLARQLVTFIATVFLARLLTPEQFGIFAFAVLAVMLLSTLIQNGFSTLIVQRQDLAKEDLDRIFTAVLVASALASIAIAAAGPALAAFYGFPELARLLPIVAIHPFVSALAVVPNALLTKQMRFKPMANIGWMSAIVSGGAAVYAAFHGAGIWALALQMVLGAALSTIGIFFVCKWRPALRFDFAKLKEQTRFALPVSVVQSLSILHTQGFVLIIAKAYPVSDVGLFNRGYGVVQLSHRMFTGLVSRVALPLMAERAGDHGALRSGLERGLAGIMILSTPAYVGLAILSEDLIVTLYGEQWRAAWPILSVLAIAGIINPVHAANIQILLAKGMSRTYFSSELLKRFIGIGLMICGSFFGIIGVAYAYAASVVISAYISAANAKRIVGVGLLDQLMALRDIWIATLAMMGAILAFEWLVPTASFTRLAIVPMIGAAAYFVTGYLLKSPLFIQLFKDGSQLLSRSQT